MSASIGERESDRTTRIAARVLLGAFLLATVAVTGCGKFFFKETGGGGNGGGGGGMVSGLLYVANQNPTTNAGNSVAGFSLASGRLAITPNQPYVIGVLPTALAVTPDNRFLYVGSAVGGIFLYAINNDGSLSKQNGGAAVVTGVSPGAMRIDTTGNWLIAANSDLALGGGTAALSAYVFQINKTSGALTSVANSTVTLQRGSPTSIAMNPAQTLVFITLKTGGMNILRFNPANGAMAVGQLLQPRTQGGADYGVAIDPAGKYAFVTETGINSVRVLSVNANGSLTELGSSPVAVKLAPRDVLVDNTGAYVYVANSGSGSISAFALAADGSLTEIAGSPFGTGTAPLALAEDATGSYIAVACQGGSPDLQIFTLDKVTPGKLVNFGTGTTGTPPAYASLLTWSH